MTTQISKSRIYPRANVLSKALHAKTRWVFAAAVALLIATLSPQKQAQAGESFTGIVNLNTATPEELQHLPGVGPSKAKRIVDHRTHKPFRTVAELVRVKGFGAKTMARLRPFLTTTAPTSVGAPASASGNCACACDPAKSAATTQPAVAMPSIVKPASAAKR
jgi:comEA protein